MRINPKTGEPIQAMQAFHLKLDKEFKKWKPLKGYMLRYIYFLDKSKEKDLTVPILPFSKIEEIGASMYLGKKINRACVNSESRNQSVNGGASPTRTLHNL
jgi:hypothetical protein